MNSVKPRRGSGARTSLLRSDVRAPLPRRGFTGNAEDVFQPCQVQVPGRPEFCLRTFSSCRIGPSLQARTTASSPARHRAGMTALMWRKTRDADR